MAHMRGASLKDKAAFIAAMLHYPKSQVTQKRLRREDPPMERMQAGKPGEFFPQQQGWFTSPLRTSNVISSCGAVLQVCLESRSKLQNI